MLKGSNTVSRYYPLRKSIKILEEKTIRQPETIVSALENKRTTTNHIYNAGTFKGLVVNGPVLKGSYNRGLNVFNLKQVVNGPVLKGSYNIMNSIVDIIIVVNGSDLKGSYNNDLPIRFLSVL